MPANCQYSVSSVLNYSPYSQNFFCLKMIVLLSEPFCPRLIVMFLCDSLNDMFHHQEDFRHWARY